MTDSVLFIGTIIVAITEVIRRLVPSVHGVVTIGVAALVGLVIALIDTNIGVVDISVAQGILTGLSAAGVVATFAKTSTGTPQDATDPDYQR